MRWMGISLRNGGFPPVVLGSVLFFVLPAELVEFGAVFALVLRGK